MQREIRRFEFEGQALEFKQQDGEWWCDFSEAAESLGYKTAKSVRNLFSRHQGEFLASETTFLEVRQVEGGVQKARSVRYFSPDGLEHLAILGRTEKCVRFRRWILDVAKQLRGGAHLVTQDQLGQLVEEIKNQGQIIDHQAKTIAILMGQVQAGNNLNLQLIDMNKRQVSLHACALGHWSHRKKIVEQGGARAPGRPALPARRLHPQGPEGAGPMRPLPLLATWIPPRYRETPLSQRRRLGVSTVVAYARPAADPDPAGVRTDGVTPLDVVVDDPGQIAPVLFTRAVEVDVDGRLVNPSRELVDGLDRMFGIDQDGLEELIAAWEAQHRVNAA